jgi:hypothetical protein
MVLNRGDAKIAFAILIGFISTFQAVKHDFTATTNAMSDWPAFGGQVAGNHYSPLKQINRNNVH